MNDHRRAFLGTASAGLAASVLARLTDIRDAAAAAITRAPARGGADDYTLAEGVTYLNHASIGTVPRVVQKAHRDHLELCESNPWLYMWGGAWDDAAAASHRAAADALGCRARQVAILRSTTEAFNLLAQGLPLGEGDEVLFSSLNHVGASACWFAQSRRRGFTVRRFDFPLDLVPDLDEDALVELHVDQIKKGTRVLVLPHIDNVVGVRLPVRAIAKAARALGVRFVAVDGAQTVGMIPVDVSSLDVDFYATSAHKWLQAPKGTGILYVRDAGAGPLQPMFTTWGQARWVGLARRYADYGTRDMPGMLSLTTAVAFQKAVEERRVPHIRKLRAHLARRVADHGSLEWRSPKAFENGGSLIAVGLPDPVDATKTADRLFRKHGIVVRPFQGQGMRHLRVSPNAATTVRGLDRLIDALG